MDIRQLPEILSGPLLDILATKETIASRNILLVGGILISIYYKIKEFKRGNLKHSLTFGKYCQHYL